MMLRQYAKQLVVVIALLQPEAAVPSLLFFGKTATACMAYPGRAWADESPSAPHAPAARTEVWTSPTISSLSRVEEKKSRPVTPLKPEESKEEPTFVDVLHGGISNEILSTADWMDSFFADPNYVKEINRSYVRFRYETFQEERAKPSFKPAVDLRLALPELERKTHLVFSAEPNEPPTGPSAPVRTTAERFGTTEQANFTTALQYFLRTTPKENSAVLSGVQFSRFSPVLFLEPRYRVLAPYRVWQLRFTQELLWRTDTAWQTDSRFEFERQLPKDFFFRTSLDGVWASRVIGYVYGLAFLLRQSFGPTQAVDYEWINTYQTRPVNELTEIDFRMRYRHSFWREWLFFEVAPQVRFPRDNNFDNIPGVLFRLEMFFGRNAG